MPINENICKLHFNDKSVRKFINENSFDGVCKYCKKSKSVIEIKELSNFIEEALELEYDDPYSRGAAYDSEETNYEDRFPGLRVEHAQDVVERELEIDDYDIITDLVSYFGNFYWTEIDSIWGTPSHEYLYLGWDTFKTIIKHKIRFLFFDKALKHDFKDTYNEALSPLLILQEVQKAIDFMDLYTTFSKGKLKVFRARQHNKSEEINSAYKLGSPPPEKAKANRMSPPGISMFYGALDIKTCISEIQDLTKNNSTITTGDFSNLCKMTLIDFTKFHSIPSLFDKPNRHKRSTAKFLRGFINDFRAPVKPDDYEHLEYIPTQVVTEYIKNITNKKKRIDGMIYQSVKRDGGKCVVLFVENNRITDKLKSLSDGGKKINSSKNPQTSDDQEYILMLDNDSLKIRMVR